ncbi:squalene monooxygenase-like [Gossypium australe]|uniref:Squalene monooxygenase-like n=1 Tax=Gossypium australe TaxID=47621 RepID=A0A5B6U7R4_9ROSI|nr:squalene monooxygenase-like [Gossypium australe]
MRRFRRRLIGGAKTHLALQFCKAKRKHSSFSESSNKQTSTAVQEIRTVDNRENKERDSSLFLSRSTSSLG